MVPILGTPSRVSEILSGKKRLSMAMVQRLRAAFAFRLIPIGLQRTGVRRHRQAVRFG
jgi:hypothetical protein